MEQLGNPGEQPLNPSAEKRPKPYRRPHLQLLGDVRGMTFGPSPGIGDSVLPATRKVAGT